jgi:hypothetical protein
VHGEVVRGATSGAAVTCGRGTASSVASEKPVPSVGLDNLAVAAASPVVAARSAPGWDTIAALDKAWRRREPPCGC